MSEKTYMGKVNGLDYYVQRKFAWLPTFHHFAEGWQIICMREYWLQTTEPPSIYSNTYYLTNPIQDEKQP